MTTITGSYPTTTYGKPVAVGNGSVRIYVTHDANGNQAEIGMRVTESAATTKEYVIAMGEMVKR
jgi:hypothetical protein